MIFSDAAISGGYGSIADYRGVIGREYAGHKCSAMRYRDQRFKADCQFSHTVYGAAVELWPTGATTRNRCPSAVTSQFKIFGDEEGSVNSRFDTPGSNCGAVETSTDIKSPPEVL